MRPHAPRKGAKVANRRQTREGKRLADVALQRMRERAARDRERETDPVEKAAYALFDRMGWDWSDSHTQARTVARFAARELLLLYQRIARAEINEPICSECDHTIPRGEPLVYDVQTGKPRHHHVAYRCPPFSDSVAQSVHCANSNDDNTKGECND